MFIKNGKLEEEKTDGFVKHSKGFIVEVSQDDVLYASGNILVEKEEKIENSEEKNIDVDPDSL